jgi:membrane-bound lytic murein transglycosylase MltF
VGRTSAVSSARAPVSRKATSRPKEPEELSERRFVLLEGATVAGAMRPVEDPLRKAKEIAATLVEDL